MSVYDDVKNKLSANPKTWLVTGVAGFIGSNLLEALLNLNQNVVGLDNFSTGYQHNLREVQGLVTSTQWSRFKFIKGDIRRLEDCRRAVEGVDYVLHQAALGSVPRSIHDPIATNDNNINGFLNMLVAAKDEGVGSFTYAASSSTYGDHSALPKTEGVIGKPLSPYAVTKYVNELYAEVFSKTYGFSATGLRYFNVFGKRQDPNGAYAAVIPKWIAAMIDDKEVVINGDGLTSRDFCYVENAVQMNLLAATATQSEAIGEVYNVAVGGRTELNELYNMLVSILRKNSVVYNRPPTHREFRSGDVRHSQADVSKAGSLLGYVPEFDVVSGLEQAMPWYLNCLNGRP